MPQSLASLHVHVIFSTKNRKPLIGPHAAPRLHEYIGGILRTHGCPLILGGGMPDHVHLLTSMSRDLSVAELVRLVKSNSSKWVHDSFPELGGFAWQKGHAAFAVSFSNVAAVRRYIEKQAEHHRTRTFQDELRTIEEGAVFCRPVGASTVEGTRGPGVDTPGYFLRPLRG
jgi:putative transposase